MEINEMTRKLRLVSHYKAVFTGHARRRLNERHIEMGIVESNLRNPQYLKRCQRLGGSPEKYKLWFTSYGRIAYIYIVSIDNASERIFVRTVIREKNFR